MNERDISSELSFLQRLSDQGMFCENMLGKTWYKGCFVGYAKIMPNLKIFTICVFNYDGIHIFMMKYDDNS